MIFTNELLNYDNASNNIPANTNGDLKQVINFHFGA